MDPSPNAIDFGNSYAAAAEVLADCHQALPGHVPGGLRRWGGLGTWLRPGTGALRGKGGRGPRRQGRGKLREGSRRIPKDRQIKIK